MAAEQPHSTNGADLLSLEAAAARLDLPPSFLAWAVEGGFLQACRDAKGEWCLPAGEIEEGLRALQEEQAGAASGGKDDEADRRPDIGPRILPDQIMQAPESRQGAYSELDHLRAFTKEQQASIDAKDSLIADLARQMGKLSELALSRLPGAQISEEK